MISTGAIEQELRWYYCVAAGACGLKSPLGAQLDMARAELPFSARVVMSDEAIERLDRTRRERARMVVVHRVLAEVSSRHRRTLEAAYGSGSMFGPITIALAVEQPSAVAAYSDAAKSRSCATPRDWLLRAVHCGNEQTDRVVCRIIGEARAAVVSAIAAFREAFLCSMRST